MKAPDKAPANASRANGPRPNALGARRSVRWPLWIATRVLLPIFLLTAFAAGVLYVRLLNGAVSLKPIAAPIARAIAAELPGLGVTVDDAIVVLAEGRGLEFRLRDVKVTDPSGATVAQAPDAAVTLSTPALWTGRIAPSRIVLIEPSLVLQYSRARGLSLSFDQPSVQSATAGEDTASGPASGAPNRTDIGAAVAAALAQAGQSTGSASFVKGIGLRNATLTINSEGQRAQLRIREADIGVDHRRQGSLMGMSLVIDSVRGPWQMTLVASRDRSDDSTALDIRVSDLTPSALATVWQPLAGLAALDLPVRGTAAVKLSSDGELLNLISELELGRGTLAPGWRGNGKMPVEGGRVSLKYEPEQRRLAIATSRIASGESWAAFAGSVSLAPEPGKPLAVDFASTEGMVAAPEFGQPPRPLEAFRLRGQLDLANSNFELTEAQLKAAGGEIVMAGQVPVGNARNRMVLNGRMSPMSVETMKVLWPTLVAPAARAWVGRQVLQGRLTSGTFLIEEPAGGAEKGRTAGEGNRILVAVEGASVRIQPKPGFSVVEAPKVLVRVDNNALEVVAPEATIQTTPQRRLPIRGVRMTSTDVAAANAVGDLTFRAVGPLPAALDLAEQQAARNGRVFALPGEGLDGRVDAQVKILVPLGDDLTADDTRLEIKGRVTEGRGRGVFGGWDLNGATLAFEVTDQQLEAKGDILVNGVTAKASIKRIFAAADGEQPPLHLSANLDTADRAQLGLDINEFVVGEMPVEILVTPRMQGESQVQVRANLTNAELIIEPLAWRKAPGRPATLQFEIARPSRQRTELQGFRIVGEDISLSGVLVLDARNKLREFSFHELALHVVSRLKLSGSLRADNVWDVTGSGQTLDGRDFFRSLFSVNQVRSKPLPPRKDQAGLDIKVEIDNILGHHEVSLKNLKMQMSNRAGRTIAMHARGVVDSGGRQSGSPLEVTVSQTGREPRRLLARSEDAGQVFRMIDLFPNMLGGSMNLDVNLDGSGAVEKTGRLNVVSFAILGDPINPESPEAIGTSAASRGQRRVQRSRLDFDSMRAPFALGNGQVSIEDADLRGQVLGVVMSGKADFRTQYVHLEGTYVPLQGLNSAIGSFPILGVILAGPRGEGVIGMKFDVIGPMARPQIRVNPVSFVPGLLREMMKVSNPDLRIAPREAQPPASGDQQSKGATQKGGAGRVSGSPQVAPGKSAPGSAPTPKVGPEGGWSSSPAKSAPSKIPPAPRTN